MKLASILMLFVYLPVSAQVESLEHRAVSAVQHLPVSRLDADLPGTPFSLWFNRLVGREARVVWQLNECGEGGTPQNRAERDMLACVEANAVLPDGRQVIVAFSIGTFKKGISGEPAFFSAIIEQHGRFSWVNRLRNLPTLLYAPGTLPVRLPEMTARPLPINPYSELASIPIGPRPRPERLWEPEPPPMAPMAPMAPNQAAKPDESQASLDPQRPQQIQEGVLKGRAMVMVKPAYPVHAKTLNTSGSVVVQVIVSEEGNVIGARAISGPLVLRESSVEAARKWVFKPTTFNNQPVKVESLLTFVFSTGSR